MAVNSWKRILAGRFLRYVGPQHRKIAWCLRPSPRKPEVVSTGSPPLEYTYGQWTPDSTPREGWMRRQEHRGSRFREYLLVPERQAIHLTLEKGRHHHELWIAETA